MKKIVLAFAGCASVCLTASHALAGSCTTNPATYYVSTRGSNLNSGTSISSPFRTIQKALKVARPGNIIQVEPGTYSALSIWNLFGSSTKHYTLRVDAAYDRGAIVISGGVWIYGGYWDLCHFRETGNGTGTGIGGQNSYNIVVGDVEIDHNYQSGYWAHSGNNFVLTNSWVHDNSLENYNGKNAASGPWDNGVTLSDVTSSSVTGNLVENNWGEGIDVMGRNVVTAMHNLVANNTVHNAWSVGLYNDNAPNNTWKNNFVYADDPAFNSNNKPMEGMALADESGSGDGSVGAIFMNNIVYGASVGFRYGKYGRNLGFRNVELVGNEIVQSTVDGITIDSSPGNANDVILDNIFSSSTGVAAYIPNASGLTFGYNVWSGALYGKASGTLDVVSDPQFVGGPYDNPSSYQLQSTSPARNAGHAVSGWVTDFYGNARNTTSPTIGAIE